LRGNRLRRRRLLRLLRFLVAALLSLGHERLSLFVGVRLWTRGPRASVRYRTDARHGAGTGSARGPEAVDQVEHLATNAVRHPVLRQICAKAGVFENSPGGWKFRETARKRAKQPRLRTCRLYLFSGENRGRRHPIRDVEAGGSNPLTPTRTTGKTAPQGAVFVCGLRYGPGSGPCAGAAHP
jgi:hypothetical protein